MDNRSFAVLVKRKNNNYDEITEWSSKTDKNLLYCASTSISVD